MRGGDKHQCSIPTQHEGATEEPAKGSSAAAPLYSHKGPCAEDLDPPPHPPPTLRNPTYTHANDPLHHNNNNVNINNNNNECEEDEEEKKTVKAKHGSDLTCPQTQGSRRRKGMPNSAGRRANAIVRTQAEE